MNHTVLFFRRKMFDMYPHNKKYVNDNRYTGWIGKWIDYLISPDEVYFEHLGARVPVDNVSFPVMGPTLWQDGRYYSGRRILRIPPTLEKIRPPYNSMMQYVNGIFTKKESLDENAVWLINRAQEYGRSMRLSLISNFQKHVPHLRIITPETWAPLITPTSYGLLRNFTELPAERSRSNSNSLSAAKRAHSSTDQAARVGRRD